MVLGALLFTTLVITFFTILFGPNIARSFEERSDARRRIKAKIENAMINKDIDALKRIRVMHKPEIEKMDKGLSVRIDEYIDDIYIHQDDLERRKDERASR